MPAVLAELTPLVAFKGVTGFGSKPLGAGVHKIIMYGSEYTVDRHFTEGGKDKKFDKDKNEIFPNQLQDDLPDELAQAKRLGVEPVSPKKAAKFDKIIEEGPIKWSVDETGELKIMEKFKLGEELKHPVLSDGKPVIAAGEAEIVGNVKDGYYILEFNNNSGHFKPSSGSLGIGKDKFKDLIRVLNDF